MDGSRQRRARRRAGGHTARRPLRLALLLALVLTVAIVLGASNATGQERLARVGPAPRLPRGSVDLGPAAAGNVAGTLVLRPRDPQALAAFIAEAGHKGSPQFGRYLSKGQFAGRFGATAGTIAAVSGALQRDGLAVASTGGDGLTLHFSGSAAHVASAFATALNSYRLSDGRRVRANTSAPELPASVAGSVAGVLGLDTLARPQPLRIHRHAGVLQRLRVAGADGVPKTTPFPHPPGSPDACAAARHGASEFGGLTDDQIANAYGAFGLYGAGDTGAGVHIGIFEQEPFLSSDMQHFDSCYFGAKAAAAMISRLHVVSLEGGIPQGPGSDGEALLDIEDVSGMAPGANIDVYENPETPAGEVSEIAAMVDEDRDQIITSSYGQPCEQEEEAGQPGTQQALNFLFQQGAAQGQTFLGAAGDNGSDSCEEVHREETPQPGQNPVSDGEIASQPYVLGVGGTTITDATPPVHERVWNDGGFGGAGGGGISQSFAMPSWQQEATVPGISLPGGADYTNAASVEQRLGYPSSFCDGTLPGAGAGTPCRLEPDVSAQADEFEGAVTVYSEEYRGEQGGEETAPSGWITSGGTSSSSPIWAGMLALADASPTCRANSATAAGVGFAIPLLYEIASNPTGYAASFNDVTKGNNDQYDLDEGKVFPAHNGFDLASGLGSPRMTGPGGSAGLAYYLCSYAAGTSRPAVTALAPSSGATAGGETVTVTGAGFEDAGAAAVTAVQVGAWKAAASAIKVLSDSSLQLMMPPGRDTLPAGAPASEDGAGPADVIVTTAGDSTSAPGPASTFEYTDVKKKSAIPSVTGVLPYGGNEDAPAPVKVFGADFAAAKSVSFGGVVAASFTVVSDSEILVTPPPYSNQTHCSSLPHKGVYAGEDASDDICQVEVVVTAPSGVSTGERIQPPFEGAPSFEQDGALIAPPGCGCEVYPAVTEFDYAPSPAITSVSTSQGPASLASETGGTVVTLHGSGLNRATLDYTDFDADGLEAFTELEALDEDVAFISGTEMQIEVPALAESPQSATVGPATVPFIVRTLAGESAPALVEYAGVPRVTGVETVASKITLKGRSGAPDSGGTAIRVHGHGMLGQVAFVRFIDSQDASEGDNHSSTPVSDNVLDTDTVAQSPALADVEACTNTGCSQPSSEDQLFLYPPGQPSVDQLTPNSGGAAGGTTVQITGKNLNCPVSVSFGNRHATFTPAVKACGTTSSLEAVSPPGAAGSSVPVSVTTLESYFSGSEAPSATSFSYTP